MRKSPRPQRQPTKSLASSVHPGEPARLLVVEDESIIAMDLSDQLDELGYRVCATVDSCPDALASVERHRPDLVLMDIVIKGEFDGVETARRIGHKFRVPVVFLTSCSDPATLRRAMDAAPYGYITKPFQLRELRGALEAALYKIKIESRLRESERWFASTLRCAADAVLATDEAGRVQFLNPSAERTLGMPSGEVLDRPLAEVLPLEGDPLLAWPLGSEGLAADITFGRWLQLKSGKRLPIDVSFAPLRDEGNAVEGCVVAFRDASLRLRAEAALQTSEDRFRAAFDVAPAGMALVALSGRFLQGNAAMRQLLGRSEPQLLETTQHDVSHPSDFDNERQHLHQLLSGDVQTVQFEKRYRSQARGDVWALASVSLLMQADQPLCYLYQVHDLTERKRVEQQLTVLASVDPLTGLANRAQLRDTLERQLLSARRHQRKLAVVFVDLDRFKHVNDTLGHEAGDQVLQAVATRLRASVRDSDGIARLGGDEFVVILSDVASADDALVATRKITGLVTQPITLAGGPSTSVGVSMGVSMFPAHGSDVRALLRAADTALYHAKEQGRSNTQVYRTELTERADLRVQLESDLRRALTSGSELELFYQPAYRLSDGVPLYIEALLRWRHPSRGRLLPCDFLGFADDGRLGATLCAWTLGEACRAVHALAATGLAPLEIALNVSARQFVSDGFEPLLRAALGSSKIDPARLCLELPAQLLVDDAELPKARRVQALGVRIAVDDVGAVPVMLGTLARLAPTRITIAGPLVQSHEQSEQDQRSVQAVIALGHALQVPVVAKWVETPMLRSWVTLAGCDAALGFGLTRPVELAELRARLGGAA